MSHHTESQRSSRRSKPSNLLPGILLIAVVCAIGFYFVQNPAAVEHARNALGFGKAGPQNQAASDADENNDNQRDVIEALQIPDHEGDHETPEQIAAADRDESTSNSFLPPNRRRNFAPDQPAAGHDLGEVELDQRFERDLAQESSSPVRTAELVETTEHDFSESPVRSTPRGPSRRTVVERDLAVGAPFETDGNPPPFESQPAQPKARRPSSSAAVRLTAGDDATSPPATRRQGRQPLKAAPAKTTPAATKAPPATGIRTLDLSEVRHLIDAGQDAEAYRLLSEAYFQFPSQRPTFQVLLDDVTQRIYFSPQPQIQPPYEIQAGDQLRKIANKYQLSWQYLSRLNQVDARKIRQGKQLKVFQGPFEAKVDLSDYELTVLLNGQYVKRYPVGIGKMNSSPIGEFTVREKLENPTYYGPNGLVLDADDPQNPLGERWIDIGNSFGIHGTIEPDSIGKSESAGCIRMRNDDVAEVYDLLVPGSQVRIQR